MMRNLCMFHTFVYSFKNEENNEEVCLDINKTSASGS